MDHARQKHCETHNSLQTNPVDCNLNLLEKSQTLSLHKLMAIEEFALKKKVKNFMVAATRC